MDDIEQRKKDKRKIDLYRSILAHLIGIFTAWVELQLGYKVNFRDRD
jgi:hypothetical protein